VDVGAQYRAAGSRVPAPTTQGTHFLYPVSDLVNQPDQFCSENVARQFARVAHVTGFMYVFPLLTAPPPPAGTEWHRALLPVSNNTGALSELTSFFPFDPYKLPRSSSYIDPIYREWTSVAIEGEDDEEDEEDDEGEMGEDEGLDDIDVDSEADGLGASFGGMSISPVGVPVHPTAVALKINSAVG
jgi:RNA polymerase I-specific transcription initiation factor RRN3